MSSAQDILDSAASAAVMLAAQRPWRDVALRDIAEAAGVPMAAFYGVARSKEDILDAIRARLDREAAQGYEHAPEASLRERVFEAAMARFDAMERHRAGLVSILRSELARPLSAARLLPGATRTARWLLELAGVDTSGALGAARVHGFTLILARTTRAWLEDDAGDLARTMATLDRSLRDWESWRERFRSARRKPEPDGGEKAAEAPGGDGLSAEPR